MRRWDDQWKSFPESDPDPDLQSPHWWSDEQNNPFHVFILHRSLWPSLWSFYFTWSFPSIHFAFSPKTYVINNTGLGNWSRKGVGQTDTILPNFSQDLPMFSPKAPFYFETTNRVVYTPKSVFPRPTPKRPMDTLRIDRTVPFERQTISMVYCNFHIFAKHTIP